MPTALRQQRTKKLLLRSENRTLDAARKCIRQQISQFHKLIFCTRKFACKVFGLSNYKTHRRVLDFLEFPNFYLRPLPT